MLVFISIFSSDMRHNNKLREAHDEHEQDARKDGMQLLREVGIENSEHLNKLVLQIKDTRERCREFKLRLSTIAEIGFSTGGAIVTTF
jgi:hypothetical protein